MKLPRSAACLKLVAVAALLLTAGSVAPLYAQVSMTDPDAFVACRAFYR